MLLPPVRHLSGKRDGSGVATNHLSRSTLRGSRHKAEMVEALNKFGSRRQGQTPDASREVQSARGFRSW
jgi:hypothetical protein